VATYERGFGEGQAALMRAASDGYTDGENDASSPTQPNNAKEMAALFTKHLSGKQEITKSPWSKKLINAYVSAYTKGNKDAYWKAIMATRNQPQYHDAGKARTPAEIDRDNKREEF